MTINTNELHDFSLQKNVAILQNEKRSKLKNHSQNKYKETSYTIMTFFDERTSVIF